MKSIIGYANYGVLAHEKQVLFTAMYPADTATVSDKIEIELPEGFDCGYNAMQEPVITAPNGLIYTANEILGSYADEPVMEWYDGQMDHRKACNYQYV